MATVDVGRDHRPVRALSRRAERTQNRLVGRRLDGRALCAFAHWRQMLDDGGTDPRQELDFQFSLIEFGRRLKEAGGGVTKEWTTRRSPRRVALNAREGIERAPRGTPVSQAEGAQGIEATPASGAVAAGWPPLRAPEASASPPCPCARPARPGAGQTRWPVAALGVSTRVRPRSPAQQPKPPRSLRAASRRSDPGAAHAPRGPRTAGAGAMWRSRAALPRTTVRHERPARHAQPSGRGRGHDRGQHGQTQRRCVARSSARQAPGCQAARSAV